MMKVLKNWCLYIVVGALVYGISEAIGSSYIIDFLKENIIVILIALLAINITTQSVIISKLREISDATGSPFKRTKKSMHNATIEQIFLIVLSAIILIGKGSLFFIGLWEYLEPIFDVALISVAISAIQILHNISKASYRLLDIETPSN